MRINFLDNIITLSDSYKFTHWKQYPKKTNKVYAYFESRGGEFPGTIFFGLQYFLKQYFEGQVVTKEKIDYAEKRINRHIGPGTFNRRGWEYILEVHKGYLPLKISSVDEGCLVDSHNVLMTVENTDPYCFWLTNYVETLLVETWYPSTVATQSYYMKKKLLKWLKATGDESLINFKLHDFGFRGVSCPEQAAIGGAAHLLNFQGTDTFPGIEMAYNFYDEDMAGFSIPASEHSTITSWGKEHEVDAMRNMLEQYPTGPVACVSDSFDIYNACSHLWGEELKNMIMAREGFLVIRPDSGDPCVVLPAIMEILYSRFGGEVNSKGYKVLSPKVRVIQGDGVEYNTLDRMLEMLALKGWSADNIAFGSGGGLLQKLNRDTSKYAFKCSSIEVDRVRRDVYKQPVTDAGKQSKKGRLGLIKENGRYQTVSEDVANLTGGNLLKTRFYNGKLENATTFQETRYMAAV
jgi:nicotinamide phosphoribosyltransferase